MKTNKPTKATTTHQVKPKDVKYTVTMGKSFFICSQDYWNELSAEKQIELAKEQPHLLNNFTLKGSDNENV